MKQLSSHTESIPQKIPGMVYLYGLCGLMAFSVDQYLNWEFMIRQEKTFTALVIAVPVAGFLCAIAWPAIWISLRRRDIPSAFLFIFIFLSLAMFSLGASINRAGESYDRKIFHLETDNNARLHALQDMKDAKLDWLKKDQAVQDEINKGGCGRVCKDKKANAQEAYFHLQRTKEVVTNLGALTSTDPLAVRLSFLFGFQVNWIQICYPLLLPIGIWLASIGFTGAAFNACHHIPNDSNQFLDNVPLEKKISKWMEQQKNERGYYPTQKEAAQLFGISESTVSRKLAEVKADASD